MLESLIEIENDSYIIEFIKAYNYLGDFFVLKQAMTSNFVDEKLNYESLRALGETVAKSLTRLGCYKKMEKKEEKIVKNQVKTSKIVKKTNKFGLGVYFKTSSMKISNFRPAFYASKEVVTETYSIELKLSDELLANFVFALIGAFFVSCGLLSSAEFMMKLELINKDFPDLLSDESFNVTYPLLLKENMNPDSCLSEIISFSHKNSLETILDYEFSDKTLLVSDSLHENTNSISKTNLITLGKSLIELVVFTNL